MNTLRITGGLLRGRNISLPAKRGIRYTSSKVREAIFNILGDVQGMKILDLFAGSGSFSVEALSRGASSVTAVEIDRDIGRTLRDNVADLGLGNCCDVLILDARNALAFLAQRVHSYDIIFLDPPYDKGHVGETLKGLQRHPLYHGDTLIVVEHSRREMPSPDCLPGWIPGVSKTYGDTIITILQADHIIGKRSGS